ncbi:Sperm surface protein Sp17 [Harpegnathos saltator]|uniref:Sperm surface protein Sp17 n=1 Tax=Harpegnathos saltator TaxID=610380 RepID=E2BLJ7_HARSA|nr:Sperm surface protein Sp17 [Harpegnathos saltator]
MLSPTSRPGLYPGTGYLIGPRVPHGLAAAVEGLTREVLRYRPEDIYVFAARHFEKLLKLREQYHDDDDFTREFNLWPTKESGDAGDTQRSRRSLDKEAKILERRGKTPADVEESPEDVSVGREKRKSSKQTCSKSSSNTRRASRRSTKDKDTPSEPRATKIISQMTVLRSSSKTILTKDIKQELRKNKLNSGEKGKLSDSVEKGIRCERRSRTKVKMDKSAEEEIERTAMMTAGRTSTRRPLKKARRIETESETETDREIATRDKLEDSHDDERHGRSQKSSNAFADRPELPIVMQLLADVSRNCHFRINRNSDPDMNLSAGGAKLIEPALDILMLGYPRDEATLQNRYLNFITSVEDVGSNMDYLPAGVATKSTGNMNDAQASVTSGETSVPESLREPLALPGTLQGVVIEELTSLDEAAGDVLSAKSESTKQSTATKTSLDTSSSVPLEEYSLEKKESHVESSPRTNSDDKGNVISDRKKMTVEEVETRKSTEETSPVDRNLRSAEEVDLHAEDASETSNAIFHDSNRYANEEEKEKT